MRTETRTYTVYSINELTQQAQSKAHYKWLESVDYSYSDDNRATLTKFLDTFFITCNHFEYDGSHYNYHFTTKLKDGLEELSGQRLATYLYNNFSNVLFPPKKYWSTKEKKKRESHVLKDNCCVLTGYYLDDTILQPLYDFLQKPNPKNTFLELLDMCLDHFFRACRDDVFYCESFDFFVEESTANDWEYFQNGTLFN